MLSQDWKKEKICPLCGKGYFLKYKSWDRKFCSMKCSRVKTNNDLKNNGEEFRFKKGQEAHNKKGFTYSNARKNGKRYKLIYAPSHPACSKKGYVREHRLIMERSLGRFLSHDEVVHHIDGNTLNNNIKNLQLMTRKEHNSIHEKHNQFTPLERCL